MRWTRTCDSIVKRKKGEKKKEPFLLTAPFFCLHHLAEYKRRVSILFLPPLGTGLPLYTVTARLLGAAQRTGAQLEESRGEKRTGEQEEVEDGRTATLRQAGLYPTVSRPFNMPRGNKRLAGIIALIASLLLGSCGTGAGERLRAPLALFRRDVEWGVFLKVIPVVYYSTWTHSAVMNENNMFGRL